MTSKPSSEEAQLALETVESMKRMSTISARPPLWLNFLITLGVGAAIWLRLYQYPYEQHLSLFLLAGAIILLIVFWFRKCRNQGLNVKVMPTSFASLMFQLSQVVLFLLILFGSMHFVKNGILWVGYIGIAFICILFSYLFHNYPTNEWVSKEVE